MVFRYETAEPTSPAPRRKALSDSDKTAIYRAEVAKIDPDALRQWVTQIKDDAHAAFWALTHARDVAWVSHRLWEKLDDPTLADNPHRPAAEDRTWLYDRQLRKFLGIVASAERNATWIWEKLSVDERQDLGAAEAWKADPIQGSLAGQSFTAWPEINLPPGFVPGTMLRLFRHSHTASLYDGWKKAGVFGERWKKGY